MSTPRRRGRPKGSKNRRQANVEAETLSLMEGVARYFAQGELDHSKIAIHLDIKETDVDKIVTHSEFEVAFARIDPAAHLEWKDSLSALDKSANVKRRFVSDTPGLYNQLYSLLTVEDIPASVKLPILERLLMKSEALASATVVEEIKINPGHLKAIQEALDETACTCQKQSS
jgi:hypothetical protein